MSTPKRHKLVVEITDMSGKLATKRMTQVVRWAIERAMHGDIDLPWLDVGQLVNVRVKDYRRVYNAELRKVGA